MGMQEHPSGLTNAVPAGEVYETPDQVLARIPICRRHLINLTRRGVLPSILLGRRRLYPRSLLDRALSRLAQSK